MFKIMSRIYKLSPLYGFSKTWEKKVNEFEARMKEQKVEEAKEDLETYKNLVDVLRKKGNLIITSIESGDSQTVYESTRQVDALAAGKENEFKIVGPITRQFADLYLELLTNFTQLKYLDIERDETNKRAERERYLTIEQRIEDAHKKIKRVETQKIAYDQEHPAYHPTKFSLS